MKRFSIVILVVVIASVFGASIATAQDPQPEAGRHGAQALMFDIIAEATGLDRDALRAAIQEDDATLASVIEANGGDVDAVVEQIVAAIVERTDGDPAEILERVTEKLNAPRPERNGEGRRGPRDGFIPEASSDEA